ncbi:TonB-dependent receptor [Massilia sp. SR12]
MKTHRKFHLSSLSIAALAGAAQAAGQGLGQQEIEQVVVTGVASARGARKLDSAFSISTASEEQLKQAAPLSTADVMKLVPGAFAESSGGQSGANIHVRGFPSGSDSPFVSVQMQGSPLYPVPTLAFFEGSSAFRLDDTIERVEVLRGGPSTIFSSGQPGATLNFILKKGGETPEGSLRIATGTGALRRLDLFYGGKIGAGWYGTIGGFYRKTYGVRDAGFPADDGRQLSATLTRKLEQGEASFYLRRTDDKNAFYTGVPLISSDEGRSISPFPGFDPLKGTLMSSEMRHFSVEAGPGATLHHDLGDGRGLHATVLGMEFDQALGRWTVSNKFNRFIGDLNTIAMFTGNNPLAMSAYNAAALKANGGTLASATYLDGTPVAAEQQVVQAGLWSVRKHLKSFTDELRISKAWLPDHTLTVGGYFADFSSDDVWHLGSSHLMTAVPNARLINVKLDNGVIVANQGKDGSVFYAPVAAYDGRRSALFIANAWQVNARTTLDGGLRRERQSLDATFSTLQRGDTDNNPLTVYNNNTSMPTGANAALSRSDAANSFTIGGNIKLAKDASVFVRANMGRTFVSFDDLRNAGTQAKVDDRNILPTPKVRQYEAGFKAASQFGSATINYFHTDFEGIAFQQILSNGSILNSVSGSRGNGVEVELALRPLRALSLGLSGNWQHSQYKDNPATAGKQVQRQPKLQYRFTPAYRIPLGELQALKLYGAYTHISARWADQANLQYLPSYKTLDLGALYTIGDKIDIRLSANNVSNELGLTEGNSRLTTGGSGPINARPLFGRSWELSLAYRF